MPAGRPSKLEDNPQLVERLCESLSKGNTRADACALVGIHFATFARWMNLGKTQKEGQYFDFRESVKKAEAVAASECVNVIQESMKGGALLRETVVTKTDKNGTTTTTESREYSGPAWQAAAWWLERKNWRTWARRVVPLVQSSGGDVMDFLAKVKDRQEANRKSE